MIIHGFPAIGKSTYTYKFRDELSILDMDSSAYIKTPQWKYPYVMDIVTQSSLNDIVLCSTREEVIDQLQITKPIDVDIWMIFPALNMKDEIIDRLHQRYSDENLIKFITKQYNTWIPALTEMSEEYKIPSIVLESGQYLSDVLPTNKESFNKLELN